MSHDLAAVEAAAAALSPEDKQHLFSFLTSFVPTGEAMRPPGVALVPGGGQHSLLDIEPVSVGKILRPPDADDDVFGEMLEGRV